MVGSWRTAGLEVSVVCEAGQWTLAARLTSTHLDAIWGAPLVPVPGWSVLLKCLLCAQPTQSDIWSLYHLALASCHNHITH